MEPKFLLIVKVPKGIVVRDTPRPESEGGRAMRTVAVGLPLYAYSIHNIQGVDYARLVPQNPQKPEWVRVQDISIEYVDVLPLEDTSSDSGMSGLATAITLLATAIRELAKSR